MTTHLDNFAVTTPGKGTRIYNSHGVLVADLKCAAPPESFTDIVHVCVQVDPEAHRARCHAGEPAHVGVDPG